MYEPMMGRCATCDARIILLNAAVLNEGDVPQIICGACVTRYEGVGALITRAFDWPQGGGEAPPAF